MSDSLYFWQGRSIRLRAVEPEDWQVFASWNLDSEAARLSYFIPYPQSEAALKKMAAESALERGTNDQYTWMILNLEGEVVGNINTHSAERREGTFGYGLAVRREHQRKGYAREAIQLVLRYYFEELRYQKCTVHVYSFNQASIRLHETLGFQQEGRVRRMGYTAGQYFDDLIFGITAEEFAASQK